MDGETSHQGNSNNAFAQQHSSGRPRSRGPHFFLITCRGFDVVTALAAVLCIAINIISTIQSFWNRNDIFDGIFRCYAVIIAIFVVITETELEYFLRFPKVKVVHGETYMGYLCLEPCTGSLHRASSFNWLCFNVLAGKECKMYSCCRRRNCIHRSKHKSASHFSWWILLEILG